jgi:hypothetical protein
MGRYLELFDRLVAKMEKKGYDRSHDTVREKSGDGDFGRNENRLLSYSGLGDNNNNNNYLPAREGLMSYMSYSQPVRSGVKDYTKTKKYNNINTNSKIILDPERPESQEVRHKRLKV